MHRFLRNTAFLSPFAGDVWRLVQHRAGAVAVWRDYLRFRREAAFLRDRSSSPTAGRRLLVYSLGDDSIYRIKLEAMLALGLNLRGWRPIILLGGRAHGQGRRYFRAFGFNEFLYLDDFSLTPAERELCAKQVENFRSVELSFQAVKEWSFRESWIGPQILSTVSRQRFEGAPDVTDPQVRDEVFSLLPAVLERVVQAEKLIDRVRPDLGMVVEANYATFGPLIDVSIARDVGVIQVTQPWRDDALTFKRLTRETRRHHPSSISPQTFRALAKHPWTEANERELQQLFSDRYNGKWFLQARNQPAVVRKARKEIVAELGLDPRKKTAVVFSHILWDANLFYGDDLFEDYGDWFVQTMKAACANAEVNWIIKLHPANVWKRARENRDSEYAEVSLIRREIGDLPPHVKLLPADTEISTHSLFELADYGITVRGTPGMELPCFGVPTCTAGTGRYSGLGFTIDSESREEYLAKLATIQDFPPMPPERVELAKKHAYAVFHLRPWRMKSFKSAFNRNVKGIHPLEPNLLIEARSLAEIERNGDLVKWARWAEDFLQVDYLDNGFSTVAEESLDGGDLRAKAR